MERDWTEERNRTAGWESPGPVKELPGTGKIFDRPVVRKVEFPPLPDPAPAPAGKGVAPQFYGVTLRLSTELGKITLPVRDLINLKQGSKLKLQRVADERVLILVNEAPFAHGEVVVINERFGVRVTALVDGDASSDGQNPGKEG
ncbi:MAG: FliM/FliN family flagellar motor C-terminal domain-containing protein [Bacillota bacterium]